LFFVRGKKIINCHPGILPAVRGLDAFKWTIYEMKPLGVTLHYIDEEVDSGEIISVIPTPIFITDDLETLARRHYENEIYVLSNFEEYLNRPVNPFLGIESGAPHIKGCHYQ
jgi:phosphoribosylglycinamide formyltransferase-1